jgi:tRNA A58 N-methylase Trm61
MEYEGMQQLYNHIKKINSNVDCFIDIGSGKGKLCIYMATQPKIERVIGIEIDKERHQDALDLNTDLNCVKSDKVELINKSIFDVDLKKYGTNQVFVWFSNLCFNSYEKNDIFKKLRIWLSRGSLICCLSKPDINIEYLESVIIPMSWNNSCPVYIYRL